MSVRIDKWLGAARFYRTRSAAQAAIEGGKVSVNGERVKPSRDVRPGDRLDVGSGETGREITVVAVSDKRGSAPVAEKLYTESEESRLKRAVFAENRRLVTEPTLDLHGRPTKRDRRSLAKLRGY